MSPGLIMPVSTSQLEVDQPLLQKSRPNSRMGRRGTCRSAISVSGLEQFVQRAEAAGEAHQRDAAHQEVHLAQREVVELEAQLAA